MYQKKLRWEKNKEGCWLCISHVKDKDGYVVFKRNKKWYRIHRYMYELKYGKITKKDFIGHKCKNNNCINPKHLFKSDMKGIIKNSYAKNLYRKNGKLTKKEIIKIFKDRITQQKDLAKKHNITPSTVRNIHKKISWKKITNNLDEEKYINARKKHWKNRKRKWKENYKKKTILKRREYDNNYEKNRKKTDKEYAIKKRLRQRFTDAFRYYTKNGKIRKTSEYGINYDNIIKYLKPFPKDIKKYHIDHIKPLCSFKFINKDGSTNLKEIKKAFAPKNHQWMLVNKNLIKSVKDKMKSKNVMCMMKQ